MGTALPRTLQHPARLVPLAFLLAIALGTGLLMLPASRAGEGAAPFLTALFTATSAVCVTGLAAWHRFRLTPALAAGAPGAGRRLSRSVMAEAAVAVLVLCAAAELVSTPPP